MPFDATPPNKVVEVLRTAKRLLADPTHWGQGSCGSNKTADLPAGTNCVMTAIRAAGIGLDLPRRKATNAFGAVTTGSRFGITLWNDDKKRTHADVMAAFDRAIAKAEAQ